MILDTGCSMLDPGSRSFCYLRLEERKLKAVKLKAEKLKAESSKAKAVNWLLEV